MSDPCAELRPALKALLRADAGVQTAFAGGFEARKVADMPAANLGPDYVVIGEADVQPEQADCIDGAAVDVTLHVWSLMSPPGFARGAAIASAVQAAIFAAALTLPSHRVVSVEPVSSRQLADTDTVTAHGVVIIRFHTEPL